MSWDNRVVWSEGLFLRPQHFQQNDRYVEKLVRSRTAALRGYGWGFTELRLNREMLSLGRIAVESASGVLEDGTPFSIPEDADPPAPFAVPEQLRDSVVYLALPLSQAGAIDTDARSHADVPVRHGVAERMLTDINAGEREGAAIEVARHNFRLLPQEADRAGFTCLPVTRLVELRGDRQAVLDEAYIPPMLDCAASCVLSNIITEVTGLLRHRAEALAARVAQSGTRGVAEIADFLLLQAINRQEPRFTHLGASALVHPETLFALSAELAGELATFARAEKRPPPFEPYRHDDLARSFQPLLRSIRASLSMVLEQSAVPIPLRQHKYGVHVAEVADRTLYASAAFVLAVRADVRAERLRRELPSQIKIGPAEKLKELVNVALPGIGITALPVAPRQIPFHVGVTYFEIDQQSPLWREMRTASALALHVAGEFPNLEMALWAIRGQ
ncbi:type VI secretion system baseplate subunit TssK [Roseomonas marmotae]|uniref:Type VI secretion system baseplate subunit TssK n=1 Tax=Roseomonas marmotae TaxID=2768161 RepID=A0ABS3KAM4_9PROT|nr:type VI secretion system baseplate subunit TssK [Roseomonas marmotae]MBO1073698.1 type VI secretion system baseplate subunit TssK [Roseomonas marmotae]QTI78661.1 type VI secretion system baseplate subunit TssK [Roseomonas marmotae]